MAETSYEVARARNPKWANPEKNMIDLEVDFVPLDEEWLPYTASPTDTTCEHSRYLYTQAINGAYGDIADWEQKILWTPFYEDKTEANPVNVMSSDINSAKTDSHVDVLVPFL